MRRTVISLALIWSIMMVARLGYAGLDEVDPGPNPDPSELDQDPRILQFQGREKVIIELKDPSVSDHHFPIVLGFLEILRDLRDRLQSLNLPVNIKAGLNRLLDLAEQFWKQDADGWLRGSGFRKSMGAFKFFARIGSGLRIIPDRDRVYLMAKSDQALLEFDTETQALRARKKIAASHQRLLKDLRGILRDAGYRPKQFHLRFKAEFFNVSNGVAVSVPRKAIPAIRKLAYVKRVEKDLPAHPLGTVPPNVHFVGAEELWSFGYTGKGHTIAIVDTGVELTHIDLADNMWINQAEFKGAPCSGSTLDNDGDQWISIPDLKAIYDSPTKSNSCVKDFDQDGLFSIYDLISPGYPGLLNPLLNNADDDGNGYPDDLIGWNFYGGTAGENGYTNPADAYGHGTHVAGIAAGNGELKGVAPEARVLPLRVCLRSSCDESYIMQALDYVVNSPHPPYAEVINLSIGSATDYQTCRPFADSVNNAVENGKVIVTVSAGNSGSLLYTTECPGSAERALTVGNSQAQDNSIIDKIYPSSSRGPTFPDFGIKPDLVAPGYNICAARGSGMVGNGLCDLDGNGLFNHINLTGTSMSSPHVAAGALLIKQMHPDWNPDQVKGLLMQTATDLGYPPYTQGAGRLNLSNTLAAQAAVSPQSLNFKIDQRAQSRWNSESQTIQVLNLSDSSHIYSIRPLGKFPVGVLYQIPENQVEIAPGDSYLFPVSISVDNRIVPDPPWLNKTNSQTPPIYFDQLAIYADEQGVATAMTYFTKTCMARYGCADCDNPTPTLIFDQDGFQRFSTDSPVPGLIPIQCGIPLNFMLHDWRTDGFQAYYVRENLSSDQVADGTFSRSEADHNLYQITLSDKLNQPIPVDNNPGDYGIHVFAYKKYSRFDERVLIGVEGRPTGSLGRGRFYFNQVSSNFEFFWSMVTYKNGRYYAFNDYQGQGISSPITFANGSADFRHPRLTAKADFGSYAMKSFYGSLPEVVLPSPGPSDDLLYFLPMKSPADRPFNISLNFKLRPPGSGSYDYTTGNIRTSAAGAELEIYKSQEESRYAYPKTYLEPILKYPRDEITLVKGPPIFTGIAFANGSPGSNLGVYVIPHKYYQREAIIKYYNWIYSPIFILQSGDFQNTSLSVTATDATGNQSSSSINNLSLFEQRAAQAAYGKTTARINAPAYSIQGMTGNAYAEVTFSPPASDLRAPYIDKMTLVSDRRITDTFRPNTENRILLKVSDTLYNETPAKPEPRVRIYYRPFSANYEYLWQELPQEGYQDWKNAVRFQEQFSGLTYVSLKVTAWDQEENYQGPQGNVLEYVMEPAFLYDPAPAGCSAVPPLPGLFYPADVNGDGFARNSPEADYLDKILRGIADPSDLDFSCPLPVNDPVSILELNGNGNFDAEDLDLLQGLIKGSGRLPPPQLEIEQAPDLNRSTSASGTVEIRTLTEYGFDRGGIGVEYRMVSDPAGCLSLQGRNPHPDWKGARDQYLTVSGNGSSVFEISGPDGISAVTASVNTSVCPAPTQVEISACVPDESEMVEYCNCSDPLTWPICLCADPGRTLPGGCVCEDQNTWANCHSDSMPANCSFDSPYLFQDKLSQKICADPILIEIQ